MRANVAGQHIGAVMRNTDGTPFTGTATVYVTIDNGSQTAGAGTVTHKGNGQHNYAPTQAETNGTHIVFLFTGTGAFSTERQVNTWFDSNMVYYKGNSVPVSALSGYPVAIAPGITSGTCQSGSTSTTIKLASGASATDDYYKDTRIWLPSGTGSNQWATITGYVGSTKVATVDRTWRTTPDNTTTYVIDHQYSRTIADHVTAIAAKILRYFQLLVRKDSAIGTDNATELTELNASGGSGAGGYSNQTDSIEALRDRGDAAWTTGAGGLDAAGIRSAVGLSSANLDTQIGTLSTAAKLRKFFQLALRKDSAIATDNATELAEINASGGSGAGGFDNATDSIEALRDRGDSAWSTGSSLDAAGIRSAVGLASANLDTQIGTLSTAAKLRKFFQLALRKDSAIATDNATELAEINASGGSGAGGFSNQTDGLEALRDRLDSIWTSLKKWLQLMFRKDAAIKTDNATELTEINASGGSGTGSYDNETDSLEAASAAGYVCQLGINAKSTEGNVLQFTAWLEKDGQFIDLYALDDEATIEITLTEHGSGVEQVTAGSGENPNAAGRFEFEYDMEAEDAGYPNLIDDRGYSAFVTIVADGETYETLHQFPVIGGE